MSDSWRELRETTRRKDYLETLERPLSSAPASPIIYPARYVTTALQSIPDSTVTIVNYSTATYDPNGRVTTGAAWIYTALAAGKYSVIAAAAFATTINWNWGEAAELMIYKNGAYYSTLAFDQSIQSAGVLGIIAATPQSKFLWGGDDIDLAAGDAINIRISQASGAALTLNGNAGRNYVSIKRAGP